MYVIREVLQCHPGKVRQMVEKFKTLSHVLEGLGAGPIRLLTDVAGGPFWTMVAEVQVEKIDDFFIFERKLMADDTLRQTMADYHELVQGGRREIFRIEAVGG
jgi:hypothetical protein